MRFSPWSLRTSPQIQVFSDSRSFCDGPGIAPCRHATGECAHDRHAQQRPQTIESAQPRDGSGRGGHVHLDVRDAGREVGGGDVAPRNRHRELCPGPEVDHARTLSERLGDDRAVPAHARTLPHAVDRRARGSRAARADRAKAERETRRVGQRLDEARRRAVGRESRRSRRPGRRRCRRRRASLCRRCAATKTSISPVMST